MTPTALITGGFGFLGRATGRRFKRDGYRVLGIGNGRWDREQFTQQGFDEWLDAPVNMSSLLTLDTEFDVIVHCAGNGAVSYSHSNPRQDFDKTVASAAELLEYVRMNNPTARLVYPSSAGVYGVQPDEPIVESAALLPISTYGYHKRIVEELCENYSRNYGLSVGIIRFFSIYGTGLTKQLLWDASMKLMPGNAEAHFFGTGEETRDWIHVDDATAVIRAVAEEREPYLVVNGASGVRRTVREVLELMRIALGSSGSITFNGSVRVGDPRFYHADVARLRALGVTPGIALEDGLREYAQWVRSTWSR